MRSTQRIQARLDSRLKRSAEAIFDRVGLKPTEAIRIFYRQVELCNGLPFDLRIPNDDTLKAIQDADSGKNLTVYPELQAFKKSLGI